MIQSRLSRHLKILKEAGFINVERKGTWAYYYIEPETDFQNSSLKQIESLNLDIPKKVCKRGVVKNPIAKARGLEIRKSILISEDA
jgi:ArsR family transcriptional regulator